MAIGLTISCACGRQEEGNSWISIEEMLSVSSQAEEKRRCEQTELRQADATRQGAISWRYKVNDWINDWLRCVGNSLGRFLNGPFVQTIGGFIVIFLVGLIVVGTMAAISGGWELVVGYIVAMLFAAMLFLGSGFYMNC